LTHKKISSTSGTEPRPSNPTEPKSAEKNTELAGLLHPRRSEDVEEEASSVLQRLEDIHNFLINMT